MGKRTEGPLAQTFSDRVASVAGKHGVDAARLEKTVLAWTWYHQGEYDTTTDASAKEMHEWVRTNRARVHRACEQFLKLLTDDDPWIASGEPENVREAVKELRDTMASGEPPKRRGRKPNAQWLHNLVEGLVELWPDSDRVYKIEREWGKGTYSESPLWKFVVDGLQLAGVRKTQAGTLDTVLREHATRHAR